MSKDKLTDAIGGIGDDLIAEAKARKPVMLYWRRIVAVAACLTIIASLCYMFIPGIHWQDSPAKPKPHIIQISASTPTTPHNQIISTSPLRLSAPVPYQRYEGYIVPNPSGSGQLARSWYGFVVHVKALEVLPDTYLVNQSRYRLVKMQTLDTFFGENMMEIFYYLVEEQYVTDFCRYDSLILFSIRQCSYENQILYNETKECYEVCEYPLFDDYPDARIYPITDGIFDISLWKSNDAWLAHMASDLERITEYGEDYYCIGINSDVATMTSKLLSGKYKPNNGHEKSARTLSTCECEAVQQILGYVEPFNNGIYIASIGNKATEAGKGDTFFEYTRYIDGYPTNEYIGIYCSLEKHGHRHIDSVEKFTDADLQRLPDLAAALKAVTQAYDNGEITPPHIELQESYIPIGYSIEGRYSKSNGNVYGIIRIDWTFGDMTDYDFLNDDKYYLISYGSNEVTSIERDDVLALLTSEASIYTGGYNERGKIPEPLVCY